MKLTPAERNHLLHHIKENYALTGGPSISWSVENGFMPHEYIPLLNLLSKEMKEENAPSMDPTEPWAPPADSAEAFRVRMKELSQE